MLKEKTQERIEEFVSGVKECEDVAGILLVGSQSFKSFNCDEAADIDLLIFADSANFHTPASVYETVSKHAKHKIKPTIKSIQELNTHNYVTLTRRYIQHLVNVGKVVYQKCGVDLEALLKFGIGKDINNPGYDIAYKTSSALIIRHRVFELYKGVLHKVMNDEKTYIDRPAKYFWQAAIDVFNWEISPKEEDKIIEKFYEKISCGTADEVYTIRNSINAINKKLANNGFSEEILSETKKVYFKFKNIVERDIGYLNLYLVNDGL